jgi:hypothetical protein
MGLPPDAIPTIEDINCFGSLDEETAVEHFLGKNLIEAEELFRENSNCYIEDLMWMAGPGFCYYVQAAVAYIKSEAAFGDFEAILFFEGAIAFQLKHYPNKVRTVAELLGDASSFILDHMNRFDVAEMDGYFRNRYVELKEGFGRLARELDQS